MTRHLFHLAMSALFLCASQPLTTWALPGRQIIAVFPVEVARGVPLTEEARNSLVELITARLTLSRRFQVVPREQLRKELISLKVSSYKECFDQSCQIEIGKAVSATKYLSAKVQRLADTCSVFLTVFDLKREYSDAAGIGEGPCNESDIIESFGRALDQLTGNGTLVIESIPSGAGVWLDGVAVGETPLTLPDQASGEYVLEVRKPTFLPHQETILIQYKRTKHVSVKLAGNHGRIMVTSMPPGADIQLDGIHTGKKTPAMLENVPPGATVVGLSMEAHDSASQTVNVAVGQQASAELTLVRHEGVLTVKPDCAAAEACEGTCLLVANGTPLGPVGTGYPLLATTHEVEVRCPMGRGKATIRVPKDQEISFIVRVMPTHGSLTVKGRPRKAKVVVHCADQTAFQEVAPATMMVPEGNCDVTVSSSNFETFSQSIAVTAGTEAEVAFKLAKNTGPGDKGKVGGKVASLLLEADLFGIGYAVKGPDPLALLIGPVDLGVRLWDRLRLGIYIDASAFLNGDAPDDPESGSARWAIGTGGILGVEILTQGTFGLSFDAKAGFEGNTDRCAAWDDGKNCTSRQDVPNSFVTGGALRFKFMNLMQATARVNYSLQNGVVIGASIGVRL